MKSEKRERKKQGEIVLASFHPEFLALVVQGFDFSIVLAVWTRKQSYNTELNNAAFNSKSKIYS